MEYKANAFYAIMQNYEKLEAVKEKAEHSQNSAMAEQITFANSLEGKLTSLKENIKGFFLDIENTDFLKGMISGVNAGVSALRFLIQHLGSVNTIVGTLIFSLTSMNSQFRKMALKNNFAWINTIENKYSKINQIFKRWNDEASSRIEALHNIKSGQTQVNMSLGEYTKKMTKARGKILAARSAMISLRGASLLLESALTAGVSMLISFAITGLIKVIDSLHTTREELNQLNADFVSNSGKTTETITNSEEKLKQIKELQSQLAKTTNEQERIKLQEKLNTLQKEMCQLLPESKSGYNKEGQAISSNNALIEEQIKLKKQQMVLDAQKVAKENKDKLDFGKYFDKQKEYNELQSGKHLYNKDDAKMQSIYGNSNVRSEKSAEKTFKEMNDMMMQFNTLKSAIDTFRANGYTDLQINAQFGGQDVIKMVDDFNNKLQETQNEANNVEPPLKTADQILEEMASSAVDAANELDKLGSKFSKLTGNIGLVQKAMAEYKKSGTLSASTVGSMLSSGDSRIVSLLADKNHFMQNSIALEKTLRGESQQTYQQALAQAQSLKQQGINDLSSKEAIEAQAANNSIGISNQVTQAKANNYSNDVNNHANSENIKDANAQNSSNARTGAAANEANQKSGMYANDANNHGEGEGTKVKNSVNASNTMLDANSQMVNKLADGYQADATNFEKLTNDKIEMIDVFASKFDWTFAQAYKKTGSLTDSVREANKVEAGLPSSFDIPKQPSILEVGKKFGKANSNFDPIKVSTNPVGVDYSPEANGSGSSGSKGGKGSKGNKDKGQKVDIKDIEDKIDKYKALQDAIDDVNNDLEVTKTLEENANGSDKLYYMNQELILYKEKKKAVNDLCWAKKQEAKALEEELIKNGFEAKNGDIANYTERLEAIKANVNAMDNSNKSKEKAIENYKKLKETADDYFNLTSKEIPQLQKEWYSLVKTIKEVSENQVKLMGDTEREMTNVIKDQVDKRRKEIEEATDKEKKSYEDRTKKLKEELQKQRDAYNENNDNDDFEQNLKEKQDKVNEINKKIDSVKRDNSGDGQSRLKDLLKQKEEAEKDLNKFIKDRQKDQANKAFDKQMDDLDKSSNKKSEDLDKQKEDILKAFNDKYTSEKIGELAKGMIDKGFIEIEGHIIKLRDALNDYYKSQGEVFADSSLKMQKYIDNLELTKKLYLELTSINNNLGISSSNVIKNNGNNIIPITTPKPMSFIATNPNKPQINLESNLNIGTVNKATLSDVQNMLERNNKKIMETLKESLVIH